MKARRHVIWIAAMIVAAVVASPLAVQQRFRSGIEVVLIPALVTDRNRPVTGLRASDFVLTDNGVPQTVTSTLVESLPIDVTLLIDASGSVSGPALARFKADVQAIVDGLNLNDRVRLLAFATNVVDVSGLQPGGAPLPLQRLVAGGATSVYDAMAAAFLSASVSERPHLIFAFTDGLDNMSFTDASHVAALARMSGASLYVAQVEVSNALVDRQIWLSPFQGRDPSVLRDVAEITGGRLFTVPATSARMVSVFQDVIDEFRTTYVLRYTPQGVARAGWHDVEVRTTTGRYSVRARRGYDGG